MLKKEARLLFGDKRKKLTAAEQLKWDDLLLIQFQKTNIPFLNSLLSYYPLQSQKEVNTFLFTDYLLFVNPGLQLYYPKINEAENTFTAVLAHEDTAFMPNKYGIPEPVEKETIEPQFLDVVIVPLLAFDERGYRVGYGKGYYDRFLSMCQKDCIKIGFSYFEPVEVLEDADGFDVPLNICITPQKAYVF